MVLIREEQKAFLLEKGITGAALELLLKDLAPRRHESRVLAAYSRALDAVEMGDDRHIKAAGLCLLDLAGNGLSKTERLDIFQTLGKGRKMATDGPAWTAAIKEAMARLLKAAELPPDVVIAPADTGVGVVCRDKVVPIPTKAAWLPWHLNLAKEAMRRRLNENVEPNQSLGTGINIEFFAVGELEKWVQLVNKLIEQMGLKEF